MVNCNFRKKMPRLFGEEKFVCSLTETSEEYGKICDEENCILQILLKKAKR